MNINSISSTGAAALGEAQQDIGREEFLQLLLAQLTHQDPMNPMEDREFVAELAQFTSLEQAMETNQRLELLQVAQSSVGEWPSGGPDRSQGRGFWRSHASFLWRCR